MMIANINETTSPNKALNRSFLPKRNALKSQGWQPERIEFMLNLFSVGRQGWTADVSPDVSSVLGREPISFEQFARDKAKAWK